MSYVATGPDLSPHKSILDSYTPRYPGSLPNSPSTFHHFPPLLRSYQGFSMATSYSGGDGDSLVVALQPTDPVNSSASLHQLETTPSISSHPSRPTSPLLDDSTSFYTSYDASQTIPAPSEPSHPRSHSAEELISSYPSHTPELDQTSRASSINYSKTIKVVQWTPQRGDAGTQVTIILDSSVIRLAQPTLQNSSAPPFFGPGSNSSPDTPINRTFSVLFGQAPAPTDFTRAQAIDGNGVGQSMNAGPNSEDAFVVLTTFTPSRQAMGPVGEPVLVIVQVLDENAGVVESTIVGTWDVGAAPATPSRLNALKRSGDELVSDRDAPGIRSPSQSQLGSPVRPGAEWTSPSMTQLGIPAIRTSSTETDAQDSNGVVPAATPAPTKTAAPQAGTTLVNGQPELIRTSQIHAPKQGFGATYSHKVVLKLQGDLNTMAMGWTNEEWQNRRRLIQFWPQQEGNIINVAFRPVPQNDWQPNSITVSCIFRDEWNECFVTSVDTIYLLEALVGSRFSVEEKNRIRRNLEGFKPLTVSKSKPDAEPFFKLIMGFPQPKPRNIEKDVKVFPWKILSNALKKIMSKYSANYPLNADGSNYTPDPGDQPSTSQAALAAPVSPHLASTSHTPSPHAVSNSPHIPQSPHLGQSSSGHFSHTSTPHLNQSPNIPSGAFVPRSPQLQQIHSHSPNIPHSPQRLNLVAPVPSYSRGPYDIPSSSSYDSRDYSIPQHNVYGSIPPSSNGHQNHHQSSHHQQQQLFPSAEDYGVNAQHLAPPSSSNNLNHYRSYSEGLPRSVQDGPPSSMYTSAPPIVGQSFNHYDPSSHAASSFYAQSQQDWGPSQPLNGGGGGGSNGDLNAQVDGK